MNNHGVNPIKTAHSYTAIVSHSIATTNVCRPGIGNKEVNLIMIAPLHKDITTMKQYK